MGHHAINKHFKWDLQCLLSSLRGFHNGVVTGVRVRLPYIFHAAVFALLFREGNVVERMKFILKQMLYHARNLGMFVGIYKAICCIMRNIGIDNGIESLIAGFIGGSFAFGDTNGVSGSVNNQIVLYLFARGIQGAVQSAVNRAILPSYISIATPNGFRVFAGFTLALILYLTEHEPETLGSGFMSTMTFLYHKSDSPQPPTPPGFLPFLAIIILSLFGYLGVDNLKMPNLISRFLG